MIEQVSRLHHLTETIPLSVYNRVFSMESEIKGKVGYYDATSDIYIDELPSSKVSEVKIENNNKMTFLKFD